MFDEWRQKRAVRRRLAEMEKKYFKDITLSESQQHGFISNDYRFQRSLLEGSLKVYRTQRLSEKASGLGINVEDELPRGSGSWWHTDQYTKQIWLSESGEAKLNQLIRDKRYHIVKKWSDLFSPIAATIIALLALAISALALYLQYIGNSH